MLPLIPLAITLMPEIAKWLFGPKAEDTAKTIAGVVATVAGTSDPLEAATALSDPAKAADLRVQLAQIAAQAQAAQDATKLDELKASLADIANARSQTVSLAQAGSKIAWGAPVISLVVVLGFFIIFGMLLFGKPQADPGTAAMLNILVGAVSAAFAGVIAFWIGSSAGSSHKNDMISAMIPAAVPSAADDLNANELSKLK